MKWLISQGRMVVEITRDILRGLFSAPISDAPAGMDYAAELEDRYSTPRRCC